MTVSFHHYGDFFPGTGSISDIGVDSGRNYALNFPLREGMDDDSFVRIFKDIVDSVLQHFRPSVVVLQCGADSLTGDRLGVFNLTIRGHGACVEYMAKWNLPLIVLGGGGYTIRNVARCWAYETGILLNTRLPDELPYNEYYEYYGPEYKLHIPPGSIENRNSRKELHETTVLLQTLLRELEFAPSVQYSNSIPPSVHDALPASVSDTVLKCTSPPHPEDVLPSSHSPAPPTCPALHDTSPS
uniref:Type-1 histone deacetylase 1 n=1 Tax=Lygus hesperus TaxID=30085 RepID=A0A146LGH5_LYGHE